MASSPLLEQLLFEDPALLALGLLVLALAAWAVSRRRASRALRGVAVAALVLAVGIVVLARFVTTTRESLEQRTHQAVHLTAPLDVAAFRQLCDPEIVVSGPDDHPWLQGPAVLAALEAMVRRHPLEKQGIRGSAVALQGPDRASVELHLTTIVPSLGEAVPTTWLLHWRRGSDGQWRLERARWLTIRDDPARRDLLR